MTSVSEASATRSTDDYRDFWRGLLRSTVISGWIWFLILYAMRGLW